MSQGTAVFVSVVIPTYREWGVLQKCLDALSRQSYPSQNLEIIVVNNDPSDPVPSFLKFSENVIFLTEKVAGSYAARNTGIRAARGEIVGFTDSDCIPDTNWVRNAVDFLKGNPSCSRVAGNISIIFKGSRPTVIEMYNEIYAFPQQWLIANGGGSITGNLFTYKKVFEEVGYFDERLLSMGDMVWGKMAQRSGYLVHYVANVIVKHPARDFKALVKKEKRHGGGVARMSGAPSKRLREFFNLAYQMKPDIRSLRFLLSRRDNLGIQHRLLIPLLRYYLMNIRRIERFKVQMGKEPNRE